MFKFRPLIIVLALALGACTSSAVSAGKHKPPTKPATPVEKVVEVPDPGDGAGQPVLALSKSQIPHWPSVHSHVGGLPVPRGWKLVERKADGYRLDETYESPQGVAYEQVLTWYRARISSDKPWVGWTPCYPGGNGDAGLYDGPELWAWRNPGNPTHSIQISVGGSLHRGRSNVSLERNDFGEECFV